MNYPERYFSTPNIHPDARGSHDSLFEDWTDSRRMSEYAQTGNGVYLTPELARKMKVSVETMREVPGATEADLEFAEQCDIEKNKTLRTKQYG